MSKNLFIVSAKIAEILYVLKNGPLMSVSRQVNSVQDVLWKQNHKVHNYEIVPHYVTIASKTR